MMTFAHGLAPALRRVLVVLAVAAVSLPLAACSDEGKLVLNSDSGTYTFNVEVVDTPQSRAAGLMYRTELADDAGMLFDFKEQREVAFWMRNTLIPLDMIFINSAGVVKSIYVNAIPGDETSIPSGAPVQFVLEIPGGRSVEIGLKPGDTMEHDLVSKPAG